MEAVSLAQIASQIRQAGIDQAFTPDVARLTTHLWRLLAQGRPVPPGEIEEAAATLGIPAETARSVIQKMCERDGKGNVVGIAGLSQKRYAHRFKVNGKTFSTWCAWDSIFLPIMLGQTAEVQSACPVTQRPVRLTLGPVGIKSYEPEGLVVSIVTPAPTQQGLESVEEIWMTFCNHIHFFTSRAAAQQYFTARNHAVELLTPEQTFDLSRLVFQDLLQYL